MAVTFCSMRSRLCAGRPLSDRAQEMGFRIGLGSGADVDGVCHLQRHPASGRIMMPYLNGVADRQRLGMKMKLHRNRAFAGLAKLATSGATNGNLPVRRGAIRHWNDKGALRMNVGMRVRGGLLAALIMFALPVAATLAAVLVSSPAAAQTVASIVRSRATGASRSRPSARISSRAPGGVSTRAPIDDGLKALIETGLFQDVKINQAGGHLVVTVVENPVIGRVAFEGNKKVKDEQLSGGNAIQAARYAVASDGPVRRPADRRNLSPRRPL